MEQLERIVEQCIDEIRTDRLTEERLIELREAIRSKPPRRWDLLYLQAAKTSETSDVVGMRMIRDGKVVHPLPEPDNWPYKTVLEAINDGWRIVKFPELALLMDESRTYGLSCEFILERRSAV
jgi:hypothetical protein